MPDLAVAAADIEATAVAIADDVVRTHSSHSQTLSTLTGATVVVKFENLQFTASFKDRGAAAKLRSLTEPAAAAGVVAASAGNHAQGVAYHAGQLGIPATIVMPTSAPFSKVTHTQNLGATVIQEGVSMAEAAEAANDVAERDGLTWVHPYDDPVVIAGQGTVGLELLEDHPDLDAIVVPVGGGGLIAGVATIAKQRNPTIEIVGVQSETYPAVAAALAGEHFDGGGVDTVADGIAVKLPGQLTLPIVRALVDEVLVVSEDAMERAIDLYIEIEKTVAEGAGAASLAAVLEHPDRFAGKRIGLILSGGNIDSRLLASVLMRGLARDGRINRVVVHVDDLPGRLARVATLIGNAGGNVFEVTHRRTFDHISARSTNIEFVIETRDEPHLDEIVGCLRDDGYEVELP